MNIIHITYTDDGGAGLAALRINQSLNAIGVRSKMLVCEKKSDDDTVYKVDPVLISGRCQRKNKLKKKITNWLKYKGLCLSEEEKDARYLNQIPLEKRVTFTSPITDYRVENNQLLQDADIIHLHWVASFINYESFFSSVKKPIVWTLHDENIAYGGFHYKMDYDTSYIYYQRVEDRYRHIKQAVLTQSDNIRYVALSEYMHSLYSKQPFVQENNLYCIHNSVNTKVFKIYNKNQARSIYNINPNDTVYAFCCVSLKDPRKGLSDLIASLEQMPDRDNITLLCIGGGELPRKTNLSIVRTGSLYNQNLMALSLSCADYFVMPSYQEAFAQTPLEAMACGVPVIAYPCSGTKELITLDNGVRCSSFSKEALLEGIKEARLHQYDPTIIRNDVSTRFSPDKIAKDYLKVYNEILNN